MQETTMYAIGKINVLQSPSANATVIGTANHAQPILIALDWTNAFSTGVNLTQEWLPIVWNGKTAYVHSAEVSALPLPEPESNTWKWIVGGGLTLAVIGFFAIRGSK